MSSLIFAITIVALLVFLLRTVYVAKFGLSDRLQQPLRYGRIKRLLNLASIGTLLIASILAAFGGQYFVAAGLVVGSLLISHAVKFTNFRRAVTEKSESRMSSGEFVFQGMPIERDKWQ
jgi:hypothetical protein